MANPTQNKLGVQQEINKTSITTMAFLDESQFNIPDEGETELLQFSKNKASNKDKIQQEIQKMKIEEFNHSSKSSKSKDSDKASSIDEEQKQKTSTDNNQATSNEKSDIQLYSQKLGI